MSQMIYDVIVIGGGPAGSTAAFSLAKRGFKVLVLEKTKFPRDHVGESLLPFCYHMFEELGVLEKMKARFTRKPGVTFSNIDGSMASNWCFHEVIKDTSYLSFHVHRAEFDLILLENCRQNGGEVREETKVEYVDFESDSQLVTIKANNKEGEAIEFKTRFVVDASGQDTLLAKQMNCKQPFTSMTKRVAFSSHWAGATLDPVLASGNIKIVHLEGDKLGWLWMIPVFEDRLSIGVAVNMSYAKSQRRILSKQHKDWVRAFYLQELQSSPVAVEVINRAQTITPIAANSDFSYYTENKFNDRYAIIGDASAFLDPVFSSGIYLGMKSALLVGEGIGNLLENGNMDTLINAYKDIAGAYQLIEKLINVFYEPGSIQFSGADKVFDQSYVKFETAYSILHLILAGDFFTNSQKYIKAIDLLKNPAMIRKYRNLIDHPEVERNITKTCVREETSGH